MGMEWGGGETQRVFLLDLRASFIVGLIRSAFESRKNTAVSSDIFLFFLTRCLFAFPAILADVGWRHRGACCSADKPVPGLGQESLSLTG